MNLNKNDFGKLISSISRDSFLALSALIVMAVMYAVVTRINDELYITIICFMSLTYGAIVTFKLKSSNVDQTYKSLTESIKSLENHIHEYGRLLKWKGYGNTVYRPEDFQDIYRQVILDVSERIYAINYMTPDQWKNNKMDKMLFILKGKKEGGEHILAQRIFIFDTIDEMRDFSSIIERNMECGFDVYCVLKSAIMESNIYSGVINETFIVFDENCITFNLKERKMISFRTSVDESETKKYKEIFDKIRRISTDYKSIFSQ